MDRFKHCYKWSSDSFRNLSSWYMHSLSMCYSGSFLYCVLFSFKFSSHAKKYAPRYARIPNSKTFWSQKDLLSLTFSVRVLGRVQLFCSPMDCSPPGSSAHGISQTRLLEWVAISSSRWSSWPKDRTYISCVSCTGRQVVYH